MLEIISETYNPADTPEETIPILNLKSENEDPHYLSFTGGRCIVHWGSHPLASTSYFGPSDLFIDILRKRRDPVQCILRGQVRVEGDIAFFINLRNSFSIVDHPLQNEQGESFPVYRGKLKLSQRFVYLIFAISGFAFIAGDLIGRSAITAPATLGFTSLIMIYLALTDRIKLVDLLMYLFFPLSFLLALQGSAPGKNGLFFSYNLYMMVFYTSSFLLKRTVISRFNSMNINGTEYLDTKRNEHLNNISILWILLFNGGIAVTLIPWGLSALPFIFLNLYLLGFAVLTVFTFMELKS